MDKLVKEELDKLLSLMSINDTYDLNIEEIDGSSNINISFKGDNLGYLIGNHGKHLESLQYVFSLILRKKFPEDTLYRVIVDVCGYKEERNKKLEKYALQKADDARILGEAVELSPMSPSDRRVVHMALQMFEDIKTESYGEGDSRRIRIIPLEGNDTEPLSEESEDSEE